MEIKVDDIVYEAGGLFSQTQKIKVDNENIERVKKLFGICFFATYEEAKKAEKEEEYKYTRYLLG